MSVKKTQNASTKNINLGKPLQSTQADKRQSFLIFTTCIFKFSESQKIL